MSAAIDVASSSRLIESDAELARRLQDEEEDGGGAQPAARRGPDEEEGGLPSAYQAGGAAGPPPPGGGRQAREQVREAMLGDLVNSRFTTIGFGLVCILNLPQLFFVLLYSVRYADHFNSCDRPLNLWLILHGLRLTATMVVAGLPVCYASRWRVSGSRYRRLNDTLNLVAFSVFVLGNVWLFDSHSCKDLNSHIYKLTLALLIVQYVLMLLPCALLCCIAPMIFFCLPLLIRISAHLPAGVGLHLSGQQGATDALISKLPPAETYTRGMFGSSLVAPPPPSRVVTGDSPIVNHDEPECAICLSNYTIGESVRQLPCQGHHHFHDRCVSDWLKVNATCPCCREALLPLMADPSLVRPRAARPAAPAQAHDASERSSLLAQRGSSSHSQAETSASQHVGIDIRPDEHEHDRSNL